MEDEILALNQECERLEHLLEGAKLRRTQLATRLYTENGPQRTYMVAGQELLVSRTKPRRDGSVSYFFAAKQRWRGPRQEGEVQAALERVVLTGRVIEATAVLTGRGATGTGTADLSAVEQYLQALDLLRESRRSAMWKAEDDRPLLARLEDLYAKLSDAEQERVEAQGRGWPSDGEASTPPWETASYLAAEDPNYIAPANEHEAILQRVMYENQGWGAAPGGLTSEPSELGNQAGSEMSDLVQEALSGELNERCSVCGEPQFESPSGVVCSNGHGGAPAAEQERMPTVEELEADIQIKAGIRRLGDELFKSLSPEELARVVLPQQAEIDAALERGRADYEAVRGGASAVARRNLPIARLVEPEPRLLKIKEPSEPEDRDLDDILDSLEGL